MQIFLTIWGWCAWVACFLINYRWLKDFEEANSGWFEFTRKLNDDWFKTCADLAMEIAELKGDEEDSDVEDV